MSSLLSVSGLPDRRIVIGGNQSLEPLASDLEPEQTGDRQHCGPDACLLRSIVVRGFAVR